MLMGVIMVTSEFTQCLRVASGTRIVTLLINREAIYRPSHDIQSDPSLRDNRRALRTEQAATCLR